MAPPKRPAYERLMSRTDASGEHWLWRGYVDALGYGRMRDDESRMAFTHRVSWAHHRGPIPEGMVLDHICRVPTCVRPDHLRAVTQQVNILAGTGPAAVNAQKTACPRGHGYDGADASGRRTCRTCKNDEQRERYWRVRSNEEFPCGHLRAETGKTNRLGREFCGPCWSARRRAESEARAERARNATFQHVGTDRPGGDARE